MRSPIELDSRQTRAFAIIAVATTTAIIGGRFLQDRIYGQPQLSDKIPISGPAIPGAHAEQQRQTLSGIDLLMAHPEMQEWTERLPEGTKLRIMDYEPNRRPGRVVSRTGLKTRWLSDETSPTRFPWLRWGDNHISWRFQFIVQKPDKPQEQWVGLEERTVAVMRNEFMGDRRLVRRNLDRIPLGYSYDLALEIERFAALEQENEILIEVGPEPQTRTVVDWPRPQ